MKKIIAVTLMILTVTCYTKVFGQKPAVVATNDPGWHRIGQTTASFKMQNESISVLGADEFTAIKIKVSEAPLQIERLQVFYESGDMEDIDVRSHFSNGTESRAIQLKHPDKDIKKVAFTYKTAPNADGEKADVELFGLKTNQPAGSDSYKEEREELKEEARETRDEINEEARETRDEINEEAREARDEVKEESREAREEAREARDEVREEAREARDEVKDEADDVENEFETEDVDLGDKIEEGAKDATAAITDKKLKHKVGPGGETAYVDDDGKYYIINNNGEKVFITKLQLKDKPDND